MEGSIGSEIQTVRGLRKFGATVGHRAQKARVLLGRLGALARGEGRSAEQ